MNKFRDNIARFMTGRYGLDAFGKFLNITSIILLIAALLFRWSMFYLFGVLLIIYEYFRMLSRDIQKRYKENQSYLTLKYKLTIKLGKIKGIFKPRADAKTHRVFKCPSCRQKVRVPKGKGRIEITCPKCRNKFVKKS